MFLKLANDDFFFPSNSVNTVAAEGACSSIHRNVKIGASAMKCKTGTEV